MPLILLNKPHGVLSQFRDEAGRPTLRDFVADRTVYPAGRLDLESEGLLLLTDDGPLQAQISQPERKMLKTYRVQVEGDPSPLQLESLVSGVRLKDGPAAAAFARRVAPPAGLWPRNPPIRHRVNVPDAWLEIGLFEGRNRQVRRMTAAVGLPTLRLIRYAVGPWTLEDLRPGETRSIPNDQAWTELRGYRARSG